MFAHKKMAAMQEFVGSNLQITKDAVFALI
jgi:hypothetical protein